MPRIVCGDGWETTALLFNTASAPVAFQQFFFSADGTPASFTVRSLADAGSVTASALQGALDPGSSLSVTFCDAAGTVREGWSLLNYSGQGTLDGYATIRHKALGGGFQFEAVVPLSSMQDFAEYMPFDNTQGFRSQLTLVNPAANLPAQVRLTYLTLRGKAILIDALILQPAEQITLVLPDVYPDLANKAGTISIEADINRLSVAGLRYSDAYGEVVALPAMSRTEPPQ